MRLIDDADVAPIGADADERRRAIHLHHLQREAGEAEDLHALALGGDEPAARHRDAADAPERAGRGAALANRPEQLALRGREDL